MNAFTSTAPRTSYAAGDAETAYSAPIDPFAARYGRSLPRELRAEALGTSWTEFTATYAPHGPVRLGGWSAGAPCAGRRNFEATFGVGETIHTAAATATGPVSAMTVMMHTLGMPLEILSFHQFDLGDTHTTFLLCEADGRRLWSMGAAATGTESALRAMTAGANRLHASR
ncbi:MAG: 2-isopropylmalate synthase [Rhodococcus sp. (in: high G+C Gram-positive bacteria)]|nr:2-isopropylmalate synthase [Rhodococcus sp. (in: high G+C Gram-positive bacteria)]